MTSDALNRPDLVIRPATPEDAEAIVAIKRAEVAHFTNSVAHHLQEVRSTPERSLPQRLVVTVGDEIAGFGGCALNTFTDEAGAAGAGMRIAKRFRGLGLGSALFAEIEAHLLEIGAKRVQTWTTDEPADMAWAAARGYEKSRDVTYSSVDLANLPPMPEIPAGVTLVPVAEAGPEVVYEVDCVAFLDEPGDMASIAIPYDEWVAKFWDNPDNRGDLGYVAYVGGAPAALTIVEGDPAGDRIWASGTAVMPDYRGRGLAKLMKSASLRAARDAGITAAFTANDAANAPMLAVNTWLGYRATHAHWSFLRTY